MILLVGLGNPGKDYARHRHNVGFMAVDAIADAHGFGQPRKKFHGEIREGFFDGPSGRTKAITLKPMTHMNDSGRSVRAATDFYKLASGDVIVFYDEIDLAPGKLRIKAGGGAAGHNGIRSIGSHLGNDFRRVRIGVGHPGDKSKVTSHVLGNFSMADQEWLRPLLDAVAAAAPFLTTNDQRFATDVAQRTAPMRAASDKSDPDRSVAPSKPQAQQNTAAEQDAKAGPFAALKKLFGGDH